MGNPQRSTRSVTSHRYFSKRTKRKVQPKRNHNKFAPLCELMFVEYYTTVFDSERNKCWKRFRRRLTTIGAKSDIKLKRLQSGEHYAVVSKEYMTLFCPLVPCLYCGATGFTPHTLDECPECCGESFKSYSLVSDLMQPVSMTAPLSSILLNKNEYFDQIQALI